MANRPKDDKAETQIQATPTSPDLLAVESVDTRGLYDKFYIWERRPDGEGWREVTEPTFTLKLSDPHARPALLAYAQAVVEGPQPNHRLAAELLRAVADAYQPEAEV